MPMLDVFNDDAFSAVSLTTAVNKLPYQPSILGSMNLFRPKPITTTTAVVEEKNGKLALIPTTPRGVFDNANTRPSRKARSFTVPHLSVIDAVYADDVQNIRSFGSETQLETVSQLVNDKLTKMRQSIETTHEYHRVGAVSGQVLDADGSTSVFNYFTEFGITETSVEFDLDTSSTDVKSLCTSVIRSIEDALGSTVYRGVVGICGDNFFDKLVAHDKVEDAYARWQDGQFLRESQLGPRGFPYGGITWINYRGSIGSVSFVDDDQCRFFPTGVSDLFEVYYAPAEFIETANTRGRPIYAKQEPRRFNTGVDLLTVSNALHMCTRPDALVKGTLPSSSSSSTSTSGS